MDVPTALPMNRSSRPALKALCAALLLGWGAAAWADTARVIVRFKSAADLSTDGQVQAASVSPERQVRRAAWLGGRQGLSLQDGRLIDAYHQVVTASGMSADTLAAQLSRDPAVAWAEPDRRRHAMAFPQTAPNDPLFPASLSNDIKAGQWYLRAPNLTFVSAIDVLSAWPKATGNGVTVADLDTGVRFDHPDLAGQFFLDANGASRYGHDFISSADDNRDGDGVDSDASDPGDWSTSGQCGTGEVAQGSSWHGTETSSVIAAKANNGVGLAGVAPDAKLLPVRVLGSCGGLDSDIVAAMRWAAGLSVPGVSAVNQHPARVINLSLGGSGNCSSVYTDVISELTARGVVIVASAGNGSGQEVSSPANCNGIIAVAGLRHSGTKVGYSNIGPSVTISAPGGNCQNTSGACLYPITTATNTGTTGPAASTYSNTSDPAIGTSFAAPQVSGVVALMLEANPTLTPAQVKSLLRSSARAFPSSSSVPTCQDPATVSNNADQVECACTTTTCGAGMLDAGAAVAAASPTAVPTVVIAGSTGVVVGGTLALSSAGTAAPTGRQLVSYAWAVSGGHTAISGSANSASLNLIANSPGFDQVSLTVTDNYGAQATRVYWLAVNAAVTPAADAPTPVISLSQPSLTTGDSLVASGAQSTSKAGTSLAYGWQVLGASPLATLSGSTSGNSIQVVAGTVSGTVPLALTVDDGSHQRSVVSNIDITSLQPSAALNASASSVQVSQRIALDASLSTATTGRSVVGYQWRIVSGAEHGTLVGSDTAAAIELQGVTAGKVRVQVAVTDSAGALDTRTLDVYVTDASSTTTTANGNGMSSLTSGGGGGAVDGWGLIALAGLLAWGLRRGRKA